MVGGVEIEEGMVGGEEIEEEMVEIEGYEEIEGRFGNRSWWSWLSR